MRSHDLVVLLLLLPLSGCFPYFSEAEKSQGETGDSTPLALALDDTHPGWQRASCEGCHPSDDHNSGMVPYECVACHGRNGARDGHGGSTPCNNCHSGDTRDTHPSGSFPDPESCQTCHPG